MYLIINKTDKSFYFADKLYGTLPNDYVAIKDYIQPDDMTIYKVNATDDGIEVDVAKETQALLATYNGFVDKLILDELVPFNATNGTAFTHVDGFAKYTTNTSLTLYTACSAFILWVDTVWAKVREIKASVLLGTKFNTTWIDVIPTEAEFLAELPTRV